MYIVGLDLGQAADYTALCVVEQVPLPVRPEDLANRRIAWTSSSGKVGYAAPKRRNAYHVGHLERFALHTPYTTIVERVKTLLHTPPLDKKTPLVVDATGVGRAITDMFAATGVRPRAITITGGVDVVKASQYDWRIPKRDLVGTLRMLFDLDQLKVAAELAHAPTLINELVNFKRTVSLAGHDSYEAWRESVHDDLVLVCGAKCTLDARTRLSTYLFSGP